MRTLGTGFVLFFVIRLGRHSPWAATAWQSATPPRAVVPRRRRAGGSVASGAGPLPKAVGLAALSKDNDSGHSDVDSSGEESPDGMPRVIQSPVLRQVYPALQQHRRDFGHPNIPLGSSAGRQCETLRRLHIQQKLTETEVQLLSDWGFRWHNLEDVYETADFAELYARLLDYRAQHDGDVSPPKKYNADPELGAWVTGIRRLGPDQVDPAHRAQLDEIAFQWVSQRQCGSSFMKQYRAIVEQLATQDGATVWARDGNRKWLAAQQMAAQRKELSETRQHYLEQLIGPDWRNVDTQVPP